MKTIVSLLFSLSLAFLSNAQALAASAATLKITSPADGAVLTAGAETAIKAVAIDPNGYIPRVEFYLDGALLGVSEIAFLVPPAPGTPIEHTVAWKAPAAGTHTLAAWAKDSKGNAIQSPLIKVIVQGGVATPVVSIKTLDPIATELLPILNAIDPARFEITRTGPTTGALTVFFSLHGTATPGKDYREIGGSLSIPAGQAAVQFDITPLFDIIPNAEPMESVIVRLENSPAAGPRPAYEINPDHAEAYAVIFEISRPQDGSVEIALPAGGAQFKPGEAVPVLLALAAARDDVMKRVEVQADGQKIGVWEGELKFEGAGVLFPKIIWKEAKPGAHKLGARATFASGAQLTARLVSITVLGEEPTSARLEITSPKEGSAFISGANIPLRAVAVDPKGYIPRVEFYANDQRVGVSEIYFFRAPDPGTPIQHEIIWTNVPAGSYALKTRAIDSRGLPVESPTVKITVTQKPTDRVVLAVAASDNQAAETGNDTATFLIKRLSGPKDIDVTAQFQLSGTAKNGIDYSELKDSILLPAGKTQIEVVIKPIPDKALEGEETVILTLTPPVCPAIVPPPPQCYEIGQPSSATAVIRDSAVNLPPKVSITHPKDGSVFDLGRPIEIRAEASDTDGKIERLDILADGKLLGSTKLATFGLIWSNAPAGPHSLTARALDDRGAAADSAPIRVLVEREEELKPFVERDLPAGYSPGVKFTVRLEAHPARGTLAYAIEDHPPKGWTPGEISHKGVFDSVTGKVKFGPFTDDEARILTYQLTPPKTAQGSFEFEGKSSAAGTSFPIAGDRVMEQANKLHPADLNNDQRIALDELTAYAAAWKGGQTWKIAPNPIPLTYVTRAGLLWREGEGYTFDPQKTPPLSWIPAHPRMAAFADASEESSALRDVQGRQMRLTVTPSLGASSYAVEEQVPPGSDVTDISDHGAFDPATGKIRWGLFLDDATRTLHYTINTTTSEGFRASLSCDGALLHQRGAILRLPRVVHESTGGLRLTFEGAPGDVCVLETSIDLVHWTEVAPVFLPEGQLDYTPDPPNGGQRYYRLRAR